MLSHKTILVQNHDMDNIESNRNITFIEFQRYFFDEQYLIIHTRTFL